MASWRKITVVGAAICVLLLGAALAVGKYLRVRSSAAQPGPWDSRAIAAAFTGVQVREIDASHATVLFFYNLDNKTDRDYRLVVGRNVVVMGRLRTDGSLVTNDQATLNSSAFVPAGNRTRVALSVTGPFAWPMHQDSEAESAYRQFILSQLSDLKGFVIFDQVSRYQIELPVDLSDSAQPSTAPGQK